MKLHHDLRTAKWNIRWGIEVARVRRVIGVEEMPLKLRDRLRTARLEICPGGDVADDQRLVGIEEMPFELRLSQHR